MATILPVLHHPNAFDIDRYASRFLLDTELEVPVVSYLRMENDEPGEYVTWKTVEKHQGGLEKLDRRAREELQNRPNRSGWDPVSVNFRGQEVVIMRCIGDFFTASDILDPEMLSIVHNYYNSDTVYVAIPHACCLIAADSPEHIATKFYPAFDEAIQEKVEFLEQIYEVDNGRVSRIFGITPILDPPKLKRVKDSRILWFNIPYRGQFEQLLILIRAEIESHVPTFLHDASFDGRVIVELPENGPELTPKQLDEMQDQEFQSNQLCSSHNWRTASGQDIVIRFKYSQRTKTVEVPHADLEAITPKSEPISEPTADPAIEAGGATESVPGPDALQVGNERPRKKKKKVRSAAKSKMDIGAQEISTSTLTVPRNMARRAPKAKVPTGENPPVKGVPEPAASSLAYDVLKDTIPNRLGMVILCLRLMYIISAAGALLGGITVLAVTAKENLGLGIGFFISTLVMAALVYGINEWVFVRGLKKCNPTIRLLLLIFSIMGMLSIVNIFSYFIFFGLIDKGTKELFAAAEDLADTAAP